MKKESHASEIVAATVVAALSLNALALQPSGDVALKPADGETIAGGAFPNGSVDVAAGTVTLGAPTESVELDPALVTSSGQLTIWVDANRNCITNAEGAVTQWCDVREQFEGDEPTTNHVFAYKRLIVHQPEAGSSDIGGTPPTFKTDSRHPGLRFLDFGDYGSGRWMYLGKEKTGEFMRQRTHTYYCVIGFDTRNNCGHILADVTSLSAKSSGTPYFHKQYGGGAGGNISTTTADSCLYNGETRLNGVRINPCSTPYVWDAFQVFGQVGPFYATKGSDTHSIPSFSTIFNDRNIAYASGASGYRQGGGVLGELLAWNYVLTEAERRQVEAYLYAKWFKRVTAGTAKIVSGARLVTATGSDAALNAATGDGTLVKQGAENLTVERMAGGDAAKLRVEKGSVTLTGGPLGGARVEPIVGQRLTVGAKGTLATTAATKDDRVELAGSGDGASVRVAPADLADKKVNLEAMTLSLAPHAAADYAAPMTVASRVGNLLKGASFETGWTDLWTRQGNVDGAGINADKYGSAWFGKKSDGTYVSNSIPDGTQFLYIQSKDTAVGTASQKFTAPVTGLYRLTFYMCRRTSRWEKEGELIAKFSLDGTNFYTGPVSTDALGDINIFKQYSAYLPPLAKGEHTFSATIDATTTTTDRALLLDKLELTPVAEGEYIYLPNAGFESYAKVISGDENNGRYKGINVGSADLLGWTIATNAYGNTCGVGLTRHSTYWSWVAASTESPILSDYSKVFLKGNAEIRTTFVAPRAGPARFSIVYSNRANYDWSWANPKAMGRPTGHRMNVYVDNTLVASALPVTPINRVCQGLVNLTPGEHTLKIENVGTADGKDVSTIVDEPRLVYVDSEPRLVSTTAFLDSYASWTTNNPAVCQWVRDPETGFQKLAVGRGGEVSRVVTIPSNGYWQVAAELSGRILDRNNSSDVYNNWRCAPSCVDIKVDGASVALLRMEDDVVRRYALPTPYLAAGEHTLTFTCRSDLSAEAGFFTLTDLDVLPRPVPQVADAGATSETRLTLGANAVLDLPFEGTLRVRSLKVDGVSRTGVVDASTLPGRITGHGRLNVQGVGFSVILH